MNPIKKNQYSDSVFHLGKNAQESVIQTPTVKDLKIANKRHCGFTLTELIVVISILTILGTIGMLALQGYSSNARDSARVTDVSSMKKAVALHFAKVGEYPMPSDPMKTVSYSGATAFYEGTFGESVLRLTQILSQVPKDPLYKYASYTYSITNKKTQFQIGFITEQSLAYDTSFIDVAHATNGTIPQIEGTYSGSINVGTGGIYITPSIITSASNTGTIDSVSLSGSFVTDGQVGNIPFTFSSQNVSIIAPPPSYSPITPKISVGRTYFACGINGDNTLKCWGTNAYGETTYNRTTYPSFSVPTTATGITTKISSISAGDSNACALTQSGGILCW